MLPELSRDEVLRYSRHLLIPEVGLKGQQALKSASVLLIGAGGLGSPIGLYLAAAGVGRIGLVDFDVVDHTNLQRQIIHGTARLGERKVESARARMLDVNPHIQVDAYDEPFTSDNARRIAEPYSILIDGTDNFPTRYLVNDLSVLTGRPYVYGSIFRFEGQLSVFDARVGPCYRCLFPEPPPPGAVPSCAEGGVLGILPGVIGTLQATEAIKLILGVGEPMIGRLLLYDALEPTFRMVKLRKNPHCKICGPNPAVTDLIDYEAFCGIPSQDHDPGSAGEGLDIAPRALAEALRSAQPPLLLDVRDPTELDISALPGATVIPLAELNRRMGELPRDRPIVALCRAGTRSARAVQLLRQAGFDQARNLYGGINAYAREVDPEMLVY